MFILIPDFHLPNTPLDCNDENPNPQIVSIMHESVLLLKDYYPKKVHSKNFNKDTRDSLEQTLQPPSINSMSFGQNSSVDVFCFSYDASTGKWYNDGDDDNDGNDGGIVEQQDQSQHLLNSFCSATEFIHCMQDQDQNS